MSVQDTTSRFLRSTGAATFSQLWRVLVTFATMLALRRWIPVDDWGLVTWSLPIFLILGAVRDLGLGYHVVRLERRPYGNLLLVELVWGGALAVITLLVAPLLARAYSEGDPNVVPVVRAMTLFLFFEGLSTVPKVFFEAELQIGRAVAPELLRNLCFAVTSLALAWAGYGVWSPILGQVAAAGLYAALLWGRAWGKIPLLYQRGETLQLLSSSVPLAFIWFLIILVQRIDPLILGFRFDGDVVGNYGFAYENAFRVSEIIFPAVARALYPALVAFGGEALRQFQAYRLATLLIVALEVPAALFLFCNAELALQILGGAQWADAPGYLRLLCFAPLMDPLGRCGGELLKVHNLDRVWIVSLLTTLTTFVVGGLILTRMLGPMGMAWINLLPLGGLVMAWALYRVDKASFFELLKGLAFVYLAPMPFFAVAWLLTVDRPIWRFVLSLVAVALSLAAIGWRFGGDFKGFFRRPQTAGAEADTPPAAAHRRTFKDS